MSSSDVTLRIDQESYRTGDELIGAFQIDGYLPDDYAIELSVLWHTEGKGDEDLAVILFQEWSADKQPFDFEKPQPFTVPLPRSPLTYDGQLIKIRWLARVRVRGSPDAEQLAEMPFRLESVPALSQEAK
jgi:hypothetical protein